MKRLVMSLLALTLLAGAAHADTWQFPDEVSVAEVYNTLYGTSYDTEDQAGLAALMSDFGTGMQTVWSTSVFKAIQVMVFDTGSTASLGVQYGSGFSQYLDIFSPGLWTSPSRGYLPGGGSIFNLASAIGEDTDFQFVVGGVVLNSSNSIALLGLDGLTFLGYNAGGMSGDMDFNEPLFRSVNPTPIPGGMLLLGAGLIGVLGIRRLFGNQ